MVLSINNLTQEKIEELFNIFRMVNRSHWKTPLLAMVKRELEHKGKYEFKVGLKDLWTQKFIIEKTNNALQAKLEINEDQSHHIIEGLKRIKGFFDSEIVKHY